MEKVRSKSGAPISDDFRSDTGTPIVINSSSGKLYVLTDAGTMAQVGTMTIVATKTYDPPNVLAGAFNAGTTVTATGAVLGDAVICSFSLDTTGLVFLPRVSAADTVTVNLWNPTAGGIDLGSGTLTVWVTKQ